MFQLSPELTKHHQCIPTGHGIKGAPPSAVTDQALQAAIDVRKKENSPFATMRPVSQHHRIKRGIRSLLVFPGLGNHFCSCSELQLRNWFHSHWAENPVFLLLQIPDVISGWGTEQQQDVIPAGSPLAHCSGRAQVPLQWAQPPIQCSSRAGDEICALTVCDSRGRATNGILKGNAAWNCINTFSHPALPFLGLFPGNLG